MFYIYLCLAVLFSALSSAILLRRYYEKLMGRLVYKIRGQRTEAKEKLKTRSASVIDLENEINALLEERRKEIDRLQKLEVYRKEFLGNVSHELKTPIFNIQGYISTLLDLGLNEKEIHLDYLQRADKSVERMISIVDDLEAITQLEAGELHLDLEPFDILELSRNVLKAQERNAQQKEITLIVKTPKEVNEAFVLADKVRIRQVLTNLVINSIKYGNNKGYTYIWIQPIDDLVHIEVSDNGIGIESEHLPRLFERFYRVDKHRSREKGGTGLGLSIVKHILEAHEQSIQVKSSPQAGTTFSFTLKTANSSTH